MIRITKTGILCSIQDLGRPGYRATGVPLSGAMDSESHSVANFLACNDESEATLEFAYHGAVIEFLEASEMAICGGGSRVFANEIELVFGNSYFIPKNTILKFQPSSKGMWSYLAVKGGFPSDSILGSRSVYAKAGIGKAIRPGSTYNFNIPDTKNEKEIAVLKTLSQGLPESKPAVRIIPGAEFEWLNKESKMLLFNSAFQLQSSSDRMGYRLQGQSLFLENKIEMISTAVSPGTIQITPDGQLIILMKDAQTTGGYPRAGKVIEADLPGFAQMRPGENFRFEPVSPEKAGHLFLERKNILEEIKSLLLKKQ